MEANNKKVAVVIPSYRVKSHILPLLKQIGEEVHHIIVVDDKCPEESGKYVLENNHDPRVIVVFHEQNKGVGGAVKTGYKKALELEANVVVKLDGDGQMDPALIKSFIRPILNQEADYVKGNRFFNPQTLMQMPKVRLFGNSMLSLVNKFVSGYWNVMDPTNGYTAIHTAVLKVLPLDKIADRYFFESDMLFRLGVARAVVYDLAMDAKYGDEKSSLKISRIIFEFPSKYMSRFFKRIFYCYFLRDFNIASIQLVIGIILFIFGIITGIVYWTKSIQLNVPASSGTVMLAALPVILGFQLLLSALNFDIQNIPQKPFCKRY